MSDCEEKPEPRTYPRLKTLPVSNISEEGATFNADLYSLGTEEITEYGFVWGAHSSLSINSDDKVLLGIPQGEGIFNAEIKTTLAEGMEYTVRSFANSEGHTVYGPEVKFVSLGSLAPVITGFEPDSAAWGDTLTIYGENFSWERLQNKVKLNETLCDIASSTDSSIIITIPPTLIMARSSLSVELAGNSVEFMQKQFKFIPPALLDFYPKQARWGDTLNIRGSKINYVNVHNGNYIKLGTLNCQIISVVSDSLLKVIVPYELDKIKNSLDLKISEFVFTEKDEFELLPPYFSFAPSEGTWGSRITLSGRFNTITTRNKIFFNDAQATINSTGSTQIQVTVPGTLSAVESNIIYKAVPFEFSSSEVFRLKPPVINSFIPVTGPGGSTITIKGKYFGPVVPSVRFGGTSASVTSYNDSTIVVKVPSGESGLVKISVTAGQQIVISNDDFTIISPIISSIYPLTGTFNDEVTIEGSNFIPQSGSTSVYFGNIGATVKSKTENTIIVRVPLSLDSIPRSIKVTVGVNSTTSEEKFTLSPHEVFTITPSVLVSGENIVINGKGFNPDKFGDKVLLDQCNLIISSANSTQIVAAIPQGLPRGRHRIKVITGGYTRYSTEEFEINSQWLSIPSPVLNAAVQDRSYSYPVIGGSMNQASYVCSLIQSGQTYRFNSISRVWTKLDQSLNLNYDEESEPFHLVLKDTLYYYYGFANQFLYGFNEMSEKWETKVRMPDLPIVWASTFIVFSFTNKIYTAINYYSSAISYEFDPSNNYSFKRSTDFPYYYGLGSTTSFSIGDVGYVLFPNNYFWKFDLASKQWTRLNNFPGSARGSAISFVLNGYGFIGAGNKFGTEKTLNDLWKYNPLTDSWTFCSYIPNSRFGALAFTANSKAYIGYGRMINPNYTSNRDYFIYLNDFYEFDPNYPLK